MTILLGIDGTGPRANATYKNEFENTFVSRIIRGSQIDDQHKKYFRGPDVFGIGLSRAIKEGCAFILDKYEEAQNSPVLLTGYSRGAAGVIVVSQLLKKKNIPVKAMLLFDAVGRHLTINASIIPNNVACVLHNRRDPRVNSRKSFGSTGTKHESPTIYEEKFFLCTHGGIGGNPWDMGRHLPDDLVRETFPDGKTNVTYADDAKVSEEVWESVQPFIRENNFN